MKKLIVLLAGLLALVLVGLPVMQHVETQGQQILAQIDAVNAEMAQIQDGRLQQLASTGALDEQLSAAAAKTEDLQAQLEQTQAELARYETLLYMHTADGAPLGEDFTQYRNLLSAQGKELYDFLRVTVLQNRFEADVARFGMTLDEVAEAFFGLLCDDPSLFWVDGHVVGYSYAGGKIETVELRASAGLDTISREIVTFNGAASGVLARAQALGSDLEKVQFIHDYLAATVSYVYGDDVYTAYSAIVNRQAVCEGYAKAFSYFMNRLGIPSTYCTGTAGGENHGWSLVRLDGQFYNLDVTWDDPLGLREGDWRYDYFLRSDAEMAATHTRDETSQKLPACTSTRYDDTDWDVLHGASGADLLRLAA
ncbi:MAG: hypothetical protein GXY32_01265 [Ruminococcaceae bacterium]|nr:hypothetical protein [Oscillospiraceae bacterium]